MKLEDYMTVRDAAAEIGITYKALIQRIRRGHVEADRIGSKIFLLKKTTVGQLKAEMAEAHQ